MGEWRKQIRYFMYTLFVKRPAYSYHNRTQVFCSWKPGSANTLLGQRIGRFQFTKEIEKDAHNAVFRGHDIENDIPVVIKLFSLEVSQNEEYAHAFKTGVLDAESIENDGFVHILDAGMTTQNQLYLVMNDAGETSLHHWTYNNQAPAALPTSFVQAITQQKAIAAQKDAAHTVFALRFAEQIASQLILLEQTGIFHHNLSTSKVLLNSDQTVTIIGLGVPPRQTNSFSRKSEDFYPLPYHPPETTLSIQGHIFTLGVILYEMLAGTRPFLQEKRSKYATKTSSTIVPLEEVRLGLSAETYRLVNCCLQKSTWNRYNSIADLQLAITNALQQETAVAQPLLDQQTEAETPIALTPTIDKNESALPEPPKPKPKIKRVKPIKKSTQPVKELQPVAETLAKAAVLPAPDPIIVEGSPIEETPNEFETVDTAPQKKKRSKRLLALPLVGFLILLLAGGAYMRSQNETEKPTATTENVPLVGVVVETPTADMTETAVAAVLLATPTPPSLQIISPVDGSEFALTDTLLFQVRWPFPLVDEEALFIQVQKNTWGNGTIIGMATLQSEESDIYELSIPIAEISKAEGTFWWQILFDGDGSGPGIGLPLTELRPFALYSPTMTPTRPTSTPIETTPTATTETIACARNTNWVSYTIKSGDTLVDLAQKTGTSVDQILEENCLTEVPVLTINSRILLPKAVTTPTTVPSNTPAATPTPSPVPTTGSSNPSNPPPATAVPATATVPSVNPTDTPPPLPTSAPPTTAPPTAVPATATVPAIPTSTPVPPTAVPPTATSEPSPATATPPPAP